jgi:RimJ/RimL family protein N-acetyltransferase
MPSNIASIAFTPLDEASARASLAWRYPPPYDFYNPPDDVTDEQIANLLAPDSPQFSVRDDGGQLIGVIGLGIESQVPGGDYTEPATDIGIGLHPELCGRGLGRLVVAEFIAFLEAAHGPATYRASIAAFNQRSLKTFLALGFTESTRFHTGPTEWIIVTRTAG